MSNDTHNVEDNNQLDERKLRILRAVIDDYIQTATPVGSRMLSKKSDIGVSSATIRNEMSDLEEMGYLDQPYTSAGRIPSNKAYRLYVDSLMKKLMVPANEKILIQTEISRYIDELSDLATRTAKLLSDMTNLPSMVATHEKVELKVKHIQIVPVTSERALAVIVTDAATIYDALIDIHYSLSDEELQRASNMLTTKLKGRTISEAADFLANKFSHEFDVKKKYLLDFGKEIREIMVRRSVGEIVLGGRTNLFAHPEFSDSKAAMQMISILETQEALEEILYSGTNADISISIGEENPMDGMRESSIVTAKYKIGNYFEGVIGVVGPTRMDYGRILSMVEFFAEGLETIFRENADDDKDKN